MERLLTEWTENPAFLEQAIFRMEKDFHLDSVLYRRRATKAPNQQRLRRIEREISA
jgi:hypothetical protein